MTRALCQNFTWKKGLLINSATSGECFFSGRDSHVSLTFNYRLHFSELGETSTECALK